MAEVEKLPVLGVLTRTLVKSPVIKFVIPARIRHTSPTNDVIFVRSDSVEVKEVIPKDKEGENGDKKGGTSAYLKDIIDKADFDSSIRSARILGRTRPYEKLRTSPDDELRSSPYDELRTSPYDELRTSPYEELRDYQDIPSKPMELPPQILALTLESSKVVFLCAFYDWGNHIRWLSSYRILPDHAQSYSKQLGEHIAVDPKSRAMAVAANEGSFVLYALMPMNQLKEQVETMVGMQSSKFNPIMDERFFHVDGVILKIEFLHPSKTDIDQVILLVIVGKKKKTKLHCYIWDYRTGLRQASELRSGQPVPDDERLPLLLIPLRMSAAFMLVTQQHTTVYTGILTGPATWHKHILQHHEDPEQPGSSRSFPIFSQWARVLRNENHVKTKDNIYLCREDGVVRFLEISEISDSMIDSQTEAGQLNVNTNTAFATLHLGGEYNDLLVVGGDLSSGGLFFFAPREGAKLMSTIPNWTPMIDIAITNAKQPEASTLPIDSPVKDQMRVFTSTGRGPIHGEITEIRYGIEGAIVGELEHVGNSVTDIFALYDSPTKSVHVMVSSRTDTTLLTIESDEDGSLPDADSQIELEYNAPTITAGLTVEGCIVQVTTTAILVTSSLDRSRRLVVDMKDQSVTSASIVTSSTYGCILLTTMKREAGNYLQCTQIRTDSEEIILQHLGDPVELFTEPSCSSLQEIQGRIFVFVGLLTGSLLVFTRSNGVGPCLQITFKHEFEGDFAVCDSIATIVDENQAWLVCGLRNGSCQTLSLASEGRMLLTPLELFVLGNTSVNVKADEEQQNRFILACDDIFCTLEYSYEHPRLATIRNILLTNEGKPGYRQGSIKAFTQVSHRQSDGNTGFAVGHWFCIEGENFNEVELRGGSQSRIIPRRMYLDGTPTRLTFSKKLDRLIVLYTRIVIRREPHNGRPGQRVIEPAFAFLDLDKGLLRPDPNDPANNELRVVLSNSQYQRANVLTVQERKAGEKYVGMTEWFPTDGYNVYHMLIVFTMIVYDDNRAPTGRLLFFSLSKNGDGQVSMAFKKITELKAPVFAVVPYGQSSLIYSCGKEVFLHTLRLTSKPREWLSPVVLKLQSRGVHFSVSGQLIHVTTAADSLSVLKVGEDNRTLTLEYSDELARDGIFHLDLPAQGLIITSSKDGTITGLQRPPPHRISNSMPTAFIAEFPGSITRLRQMSRPSWQLNESLKASRLSPESIIACTADGSLFQIDILEESSWRFMRFIANMARRHPLICPYREKFRAMVDASHARHIEPTTSNKRFMQVDGDILIRLLYRGGEQLLRDIVNHEPYGEDAVVDFDTAAARSQHFWELAEQAGVDVPEFSAVICWMRGMLVSVI